MRSRRSRRSDDAGPEPDLRKLASQPIPVRCAFEVRAGLPPSPERQALALGALDPAFLPAAETEDR